VDLTDGHRLPPGYSCPVPARPAHATRRALVEEGVRALLELTPAALLSAVGVREIARRAGVGAPTLYHHFGSLEGYADAVVARVFDPGEFGVGAVTDQVDRVREAALPVEVGRAMHRTEFARVRDDPELRVRLGLWALGGGDMDVAYGDMLRVVDARIAAYAGALFDDWGREVSPPFDAQAFVTAHSALLSGSVVRHMVDPDGLDVERFARTAQALTMVMMRVQGDRRTLDDRLTEINYYPLHSAKGVALTDRRLRTRGRVLHAAAELFGRDGYDQATVAGIAREAGVSTSTMYALFDDVADIAVQLLVKQAEDVLARRTWSPEPGLERVVDRLRGVAEFLAARSRYATPYAARLVAGTTPADDVLFATVLDALVKAGDEGALRDGIDLDDAARALLVLLASSLLSAIADGPDLAVHRVTTLLLPGLRREG